MPCNSPSVLLLLVALHLQVYKGIDTSTGDVVAIKQISLAGVSQENLAGVMGEIDLLKTLNHKNIVKYIGSFKTRSHLYIILEYMENGALSSVIKPNRCGCISIYTHVPCHVPECLLNVKGALYRLLYVW
jgi:serine/threonine protein kinase